MDQEDRLNDKVSRLKEESKALRADIEEMNNIIKQIEDTDEWTPQRFAIVVVRQQKEVKRLKKAFQESLDCEDYEKLLGWLET